jgi:hypothetical protein
LPTSGIPNDIVRLQTIRKPSRVARVNTTWKVPKRTRQGQRAKWTTGTPSVCKIAKGKRLRFRERGKCLVSVTAPSTVGLVEYSKTFKVRVKGRR